MVLFGLLFLLTIMVALATLATLRPSKVSWYRRSFQARPIGPEAVGADGYRGALFQPPIEVAEPIVTDVDHLPLAVRQAATGCRVAFFAGVFALPPIAVGILFELDSKEPQAAFLLGLPGFLLAFGQLVARKSLFAPRSSSAGTALGVGVWTLLHNAVVIAAVVMASLDGVKGTWKMYDVQVLGAFSLLYVGFSVWLGILLVQASRVLQREFALVSA